MSEQGNGRDHNPTGFTMWMAGGGVPGGMVIGSTDEAGLTAAEDRMHLHDLHATILKITGLDHMRLVYVKGPTKKSQARVREVLSGKIQEYSQLPTT